jgi:hypothetical protein
MNTKLTRLDLLRTKASWPDSVFKPAYVAPRGKDPQKWLVADSRISPDSAISWALAANDEYIRIPLFQYKLPPQGDTALAHAFKLGLICAGQLERQIEHLHIVTGNPVELIPDGSDGISGMTYWLGFAIAFE